MVATSATYPQPVLDGGVLRFASAEAFLDAYRKSVNRGAVVVRSTVPLTPLQPFTMEIEVPGVAERVSAQVQMVGQRGDLTFLSMIGGDEHIRDQLAVMARSVEASLPSAASEAPPPSPAVVAPKVVPGPAPIVIDSSPPADTGAAELPSAAVPLLPQPVPKPVAATPTPAPVASPPVAPPPVAQLPVVPPTAPASPSAPPPTLVNNTIAFSGAAAIDGVQDELHKTGGFLVEAVGGAPAIGPLTVRIALTGGTPSEELPTQVVFAQGNQAALIFTQPWRVLEEFKKMSELATAAATAGANAAQAALRPTGGHGGVTLAPRPMRNPDSPPAILQLSLAAPPDPRIATRSTLIETLYYLCKLRSTGTLKIECDKERIDIPFRSGAMLISDEEREALPRITLLPHGTISMAPVLPDRIKSDKRPRDPRGIVSELLRRTLREPRTQDLEIALGALWNRYPIPVPQVSPVLFGLKLDPKEARFLDVILDGTRNLSEMMRVAGMLRPTTVRLIYIFLIYGLIEFIDDARYNPHEDPRLQFEAECERLLEANAFDQLGVHWSEHPNVLRDKLQKRRDRFGPSSPLAKHAPELARKVMNAVEHAYSQINDREGRKQARAALGTLDYKSAASILARHAELASMRGDFKLVRDSLEMAMELYPNKEYQTMMAELLARKS